MDTKSTIVLTRKSASRRTGKQRPQQTGDFRNLELAANQPYLFRTSWTTSELTSGTSGTISAVYGASVQYSSEFSALNVLFTTVRLRGFRVTLIPKLTTTTTAIHSVVLLATHASYNGTTYTLPADAKAVENTQKMVQFHTGRDVPMSYYMWLPKNLDYSALTNDNPVTPDPGAGSPGAVVIWAEGLTASLRYFQVQLSAIFQLRGRF